MRWFFATVTVGVALSPVVWLLDRNPAPPARRVLVADAYTPSSYPSGSRAVAVEPVTKDAPIFVSMDFPSTASPGSTVRFVVTCDRPLAEGMLPELDVTQPDVLGFQAFSSDLAYDGSTFYFDWLVPVGQPLGPYTVQANCDGGTDVIDPDVIYPPGVSGPPGTITIVDPDLPPTL